MNFETLQQQLKENLSEKRFEHTMGVVDLAEAYAEQYKLDVEKAKIAALLHDCAKELPSDIQKMHIEKHFIDELYADEWEAPQLWHAWAGYVVAEEEYGVWDLEILNAIKWHTTGDPDMDDLAKLIYLCDAGDEGREPNEITEIIGDGFFANKPINSILLQVINKHKEVLKEKNQKEVVRTNFLRESLPKIFVTEAKE
ncbi:MAG: bis(5'-nucleosyl)-tetraphosphatase (symmetrical) YqeK [Patescibacteria group bacterium]|nr:bis(5'-nucleosyl)-tetraphosphatase (symmetrical) YqeK [Patescibacteria group bacterium]